MHRYKCLIHPSQIRICGKSIEKIRVAIDKKIRNVKLKVTEKLEESNNCVKIVCDSVWMEDWSEKYLHGAVLDSYDGCSVVELQGFIIVHNPFYKNVSKRQNKGNMEEAQTSRKCLISVAYENRVMSNYVGKNRKK